MSAFPQTTPTNSGSTTWDRADGLLLLALAFLAVPKFLFLGADPAYFVSRDFITDEGWWVHNARNAYLFGSFLLDDYNLGLITPAFSALVWFAMHICGPGFVAIRLAGALSAALLPLLVYLLCRRQDRSAGGVAAVLLAVNAALWGHARVAFPETTALVFQLGAVLLWRHGVWGAAGAGVAVAASIATKGSAVVFAPVLVAVGWYEARALRMRVRGRLLAYGAALVIPLVTIAIYDQVRYPHLLALVNDLHAGHNLPDTWARVFANLLSFPQTNLLLGLAPGLLVFAAVWFARCATTSGARGLSYAEYTSAIWILVAGATQSVFSSQMDRRFLHFLVPAAVLAGSIIAVWSRGLLARAPLAATPPSGRRAVWWHWLLAAGVGAITLPATLGTGFVLVSSYLRGGGLPYDDQVYLRATLLAGCFWWLAWGMAWCVWGRRPLPASWVARFLLWTGCIVGLSPDLAWAAMHVMRAAGVTLGSDPWHDLAGLIRVAPLGVLGICVAGAALRLSPRRLLSAPGRAWVVVGVVVSLHAAIVVREFARTTFTLRDASRHLATIVDASRPVEGLYADTMAQEARNFAFARRPLYDMNMVPTARTLGAYRIVAELDDDFARPLPEDLRDREALATYRLCPGNYSTGFRFVLHVFEPQ